MQLLTINGVVCGVSCFSNRNCYNKCFYRSLVNQCSWHQPTIGKHVHAFDKCSNLIRLFRKSIQSDELYVHNYFQTLFKRPTKHQNAQDEVRSNESKKKGFQPQRNDVIDNASNESRSNNPGNNDDGSQIDQIIEDVVNQHTDNSTADDEVDDTLELDNEYRSKNTGDNYYQTEDKIAHDDTEQNNETNSKKEDIPKVPEYRFEVEVGNFENPVEVY